MNNTKAQVKLTRIDDSNFFTNQTDVFYVKSNKFNNSGFLGEITAGIDTLLISKKPNGKMFDNKTIIISKQVFEDKYALDFQVFRPITIAIKIPKLHLKDCEIIGENYAKSKGLLLYTFKVVKNVDYESFKILNGIAIDKNYVFHSNQIIEKADPKTFEHLKIGYSKDKLYVFKNGKILKGADPETFNIITYTYQKDKNCVWIIGRPSDIDVATFEVLNSKFYNTKSYSLYAVDKNHIYFQGEIMPEANVKSFSLVTSGAPYQTYGIDKNNVFYSGKLLDSVDVETFMIIKNKSPIMNYDAQDKNYFYTRSSKIKKLLPTKYKNNKG